MPADQGRAREVFLHAVGLPPEGWDDHVAQACGGDAGLEAQVRHFLQVHREAGSFLDRPAVGTEVFAALPQSGATGESVGTFVGNYKLLQQIGEGGMGTVWLARQTEPVKRLVALKVIKAGMDSAQVVIRFEAERQAMALMDHPNIAKVLDGGTTEGGRPYFVMELVKGVPITQFCDERKLTPRQRLELMVPVCQAVQHAHMKGIIHRDIKPSNVLVALYDGVPVPKVIDFGVAKATGTHLTEQTLVTGHGAIVGTLEYMSPEQAELNNLDIDTRSDVYSLGVLLYELLAGTTPLGRERARQVGLLEALRIIREEETPRPSTRLSADEGLPTISACRGMEPAKLSGLVRGELDWIVMTALEKDRGRRYQAANDLALDIGRYLADEPVLACPPSSWYLLGKFVRRNRVALAGALLVAAGLLSVLVVLSVSNHLIQKKHRELEGAVEEASTQRDKAVQKRREAREALDRTTAHVLAFWLGQQPRLTPQQKAFLEDALAQYERFTQEGGDTPEERLALARAYSRVGDVRGMLGLLPEARTAYVRSIGLFRSLKAERPDVDEYADRLASLYTTLGRLQSRMGAAEEALSSFESARALLQPMVPQRGRVSTQAQLLATVMSNTAAVQMELGRRQEAHRSLLTAAALLNRLIDDKLADDHDAAVAAAVHNNLGKLYGENGDYELALEEHARASALRDKLAQAYPGVPDYALARGASLHNIAIVQAELGKTDEAISSFEAARDIYAPLSRLHPGVPEYSLGLARAHHSIGLVYLHSRDHARALKSLDAALPLAEALVKAHRDVPEYAAELGRCQTRRGTALGRLKRPAEALKALEDARNMQEHLVCKHPLVSEYTVNLATTYLALGIVNADCNDHAAALKCYEKAIAVLGPMGRDRRAKVQAREDFRSSTWNRGLSLARLGREEEGLKALMAGLALTEQLVLDYRRLNYVAGLAQKWETIALLQAKLGHKQEALHSHNKACLTWESLALLDYQLPETSQELGEAYCELARFQAKLGKPGDAVKSYRAAQARLGELMGEHKSVPQYAANLAAVHDHQAEFHFLLGQYREALASWGAAGELLGPLARGPKDVPQYADALVHTYYRSAVAHRLLRQNAEALKALAEARSLLEPLVGRHPTPARIADLGEIYLDTGYHVLRADAAAKALIWYSKAAETLEQVGRGKDATPRVRQNLGNSHLGRGQILARLNRHKEALAAYEAARDVLGGLTRENPRVPVYVLDLARLYLDHADSQEHLSQSKEARASYEAALAVLAPLVRDHKGVAEYAARLASAHWDFAMLLERQGGRREAVRSYQAAIGLYEPLVCVHPHERRYAVNLGGNYCNLANTLRRGGDSEGALPWYKKAIDVLADVRATAPGDVRAHQFLLNSHSGRAEALTRLGRHKEAAADLDRAIEMDRGARRESLRLRRAFNLAHFDPAAGVASVEQLLKADNPPAVLLYNAARVCAVAQAATKDSDEREKDASRAVGLLREAQTRGLFRTRAGLDALKNDKMLAPLQGREDFKKLLADLERAVKR